MFRLAALCATLWWCAALLAADVEGVIRVTRKLTRHRVTPVAPAYHRGIAVSADAPPVDWVREELDRVAVYLESKTPLPSAAATIELEQKNRRFVHHTLVAPAGSAVSFPNRDPIFHNVFSLSKTKTFDLGNYRQNETRTVAFAKPGIVQVYCHLHPNMAASIVVTPNRWAGKPSQAGGVYRLADVPAGEHTVVVWHPSAGYFRKKIRVGPAPQTLDFEIPVDVDQP